MKKDIIIAILVGFVIGGIFAATLLSTPALLKSIQTKSSTLGAPSITPQVTKIESGEALTIDSLVNNSISAGKTIEIKGASRPGDILVIDTETDSKAIEADSSGTFSAQIELVEGGNTIAVTSYNSQGQSMSKTYTLFFTAEKL